MDKELPQLGFTESAGMGEFFDAHREAFEGRLAADREEAARLKQLARELPLDSRRHLDELVGRDPKERLEAYERAEQLAIRRRANELGEDRIDEKTNDHEAAWTLYARLDAKNPADRQAKYEAAKQPSKDDLLNALSLAKLEAYRDQLGERLQEIGAAEDEAKRQDILSEVSGEKAMAEPDAQLTIDEVPRSGTSEDEHPRAEQDGKPQTAEAEGRMRIEDIPGQAEAPRKEPEEAAGQRVPSGEPEEAAAEPDPEAEPPAEPAIPAGEPEPGERTTPEDTQEAAAEAAPEWPGHVLYGLIDSGWPPDAKSYPRTFTNTESLAAGTFTASETGKDIHDDCIVAHAINQHLKTGPDSLERDSLRRYLLEGLVIAQLRLVESKRDASAAYGTFAKIVPDGEDAVAAVAAAGPETVYAFTNRESDDGRMKEIVGPGSDRSPRNPRLAAFSMKRGDSLLIVSPNISEKVPPTAIGAIMFDTDLHPSTAVNDLYQEARRRGAKGALRAVLLEVDERQVIEASNRPSGEGGSDESGRDEAEAIDSQARDEILEAIDTRAPLGENAGDESSTEPTDPVSVQESWPALREKAKLAYANQKRGVKGALRRTRKSK